MSLIFFTNHCRALKTFICKGPRVTCRSDKKGKTEPGDLPGPGIKLRSPALQADTLPSEPPGKPHIRPRRLNSDNLPQSLIERRRKLGKLEKNRVHGFSLVESLPG